MDGSAIFAPRRDYLPKAGDAGLRALEAPFEASMARNVSDSFLQQVAKENGNPTSFTISATL
jgi:hypothetical protein